MGHGGALSMQDVACVVFSLKVDTHINIQIDISMHIDSWHAGAKNVRLWRRLHQPAFDLPQNGRSLRPRLRS